MILQLSVATFDQNAPVTFRLQHFVGVAVPNSTIIPSDARKFRP